VLDGGGLWPPGRQNRGEPPRLLDAAGFDEALPSSQILCYLIFLNRFHRRPPVALRAAFLTL